MPVLATVELISLDGDLNRSFKLDSSCATKHKLKAGRASRSRDGGLLAAQDNLWIESPIVSREHASILFQSPEEETLYIVDLNSTHGTYVGDEKVEQPRPLKRNDIIKFGEVVMTPTETFFPKTFRLKYQLASWRVPTPRPSPEQCEKPSGFRFPSISDTSDSEDLEVAREPSLELVSSTPTKTPTTGNEVIFLSQSRIEHKHPSSQYHIDLTIRDSPIPTGNNNGTSTDPIALEADDSIVNSSGDEGPEVITRCRKPFNAPPSSVPPVYPALAEDMMENQNTLSREDFSHITQKAVLIEGAPENPSRRAAIDSTSHISPAPPEQHNTNSSNDRLVSCEPISSVYSESNVSESDDYQGSSHGTWPIDDSWSDGQEEDEEPEYPATPSESSESVDNMTGSEHEDEQDELSDSSSDASSLEDETFKRKNFGRPPPAPEPATMVSPPSLNQSTGTNFENAALSQPNFIPDGLDAGPSVPRAPSPSDAALARSSSTTIPTMPAMREHYMFPQQQYSSQSSSQNPYSTRRSNPWNNQTLGDHLYQQSQAWDYEPSVYTNYTDGPFARSDTCHYSGRPSYLEHLYTGERLIDMELGQQLGPRPSSYSFEQGSEKLQQKSSRVPISNIVNTTPPASPSISTHRPLKRKVDDISKDTALEENLNLKEPPALSSPLENTADVMLLDAQPRKTSVSVEDVAPESLKEVEASSLLPQGPVSTMTIPQAETRVSTEVAEPARKKVKFTKGSKKFFGAFASGCLAGAITMVGAAAAFVATIPASVQDEALRSF